MSLRIPQRWPIIVASNPPAQGPVEKQPRPHPILRAVKADLRTDPEVKAMFDQSLQKGMIVDIYA